MTSCFQRGRRLVANRKGAVGVLFAIAAVGVVGVIGISVDMVRALHIRTALQEALDGAVLAALTHGATTETSAETMVDRYFIQNWYDDHADIPIQFVFDVQTQQIRATASAQVPTKLSGVLGIEMVEINVTSAAKTGGNTLELALVLDTTGSMEGNKMTTLREASIGLVETLEAKATAGLLEIAVVPFTEYVNVGLGNRNASWLAVENDSSWVEERCENTAVVVSESDCREVEKTGLSDGLPYTYTVTECDQETGETAKVCTTDTAGRIWSGCVGSREYPLDVDDNVPGDLIPGIMNRMCGEEMLELTPDTAAVEAKLRSMAAWGETYLPSGLVWGLRTLSPEEPLTSGGAYSAVAAGTLKKAMVLMTDGANSHSPLYPSHDGSNTVLANELTAELCTSIKTKGILLFVVAYEITDATTLDLMEDCATSPSYFYDADNSAAFHTAFENIATKLMDVHLYQ